MRALLRQSGGVLGLVALLVAGCGADLPPLDAKFSGPGGLAVAGVGHDRLFIANAGSGALQVLALGEKVGDLTFEESEMLYLPLEIPTGRKQGYPTDLAASPDGSHVLVLDSASEAIHVVDAETLRNLGSWGLAEMEGEGAVPRSSRPTMLVARGCEAPCASEFLLPLRGSSQVVMVELTLQEGKVELRRTRVMENFGGVPEQIAISPDGGSFYGTFRRADGSWQVRRVPLEGSGLDQEVAAFAWAPGPLALSTDGEWLVVTRPEERDVVVFELDLVGGAVATLVDSDSSVMPPLGCLDACGGDAAAEACEGSHPGSQALCVAPEGLESVGEPYPGIYLGGVPSRILAMGNTGELPSLSVPCEDGAQASHERVYSEYAMVATLDGVIRFVGLALETPEEGFVPELVSFGWCRSGSLTSLRDEERRITGAQIAEDVSLSAGVLGACPAVPGRARFECLSLESRHAAVVPSELEPHGMVAMPGVTQGRDVVFDWEGSVSPELHRAQGGQVTADGNFTDVFYPLDTHSDVVLPGDILEITSRLEWTLACKEALGLPESASYTSNCLVERRIVEGPGEDNVLVLDAPLPEACFRGGGRVGYRVRMGDAFRVTVRPGGAYRVRPGQRFGPGGDVGVNESVLFNVSALETAATTSACERYDADGLPQGEMARELRRSVVNRLGGASTAHGYGVRVSDSQYAGNLRAYNLDSSLVLQTGLRLEMDVDVPRITGSVGTLPGAMVVSPAGGKDTQAIVFVSYSGNNSLLSLVPYEPELSADRFESGKYYLLE